MVEPQRPDEVSGETVDPAPQVRLLIGVVFIVYVAQMTLFPILAPLAREVGLAEWQIGVTISLAALMLVLTSPWWGHRSQSIGRRPVLLAALSLGILTMTGFAVVARLGVVGALAGVPLFLLFLLLRGVGFGSAIAAVPTTAQAYIADVTPDEATRVKGMAGLGAAQGLSVIVGAGIGGALSALGLLAPIVVVPVLLAIGLLLVATRLPKEPRTVLRERPARVSPRDTRIWPFLVAGFGMFTALGFIQITTGFLVQDRLELDAEAAGVMTGVTLVAAGVGLAVAQAVIVPRSGWGPTTLLRVGDGVALVGFLALIPDLGAVPLVLAIGLTGLGLGTAMPGYTAGASLLVERHEQGGVAGLTMATTGLTFVIAPAAGTALYGVASVLPLIAGAVMMALILLFVWLHPRFRRVPDVPVAREE